jgi:hypothetical protein
MLAQAFEKARFSSLGILLNGDMGYGDALLAGLDYRLHSVAEYGDYVGGKRRLAGVGAEAARGVGYVGVGSHTHYTAAYALEETFDPTEIHDVFHLPVCYYNIVFPVQDGLDKSRYFSSWVLVIAIDIHYYIGTQAQSLIQPVSESMRQAAVLLVPEYMVYPKPFGHSHRIVARAVVDDHRFYNIDAGNFTRNRFYYRG